jgi:UDP-N-acetylmuramate--alanine ligase
MLAEIFNEKKGIAISGTSGKTTVVGMIAHILEQAFVDFSFLCGGKVKGLSSNASSSNWRLGKSPQMLIEADESDGSITMYHPQISLITNISKDHKDLDELYGLFQHLINSTRGPVILNEDCPSFENLHRHGQSIYTFGISQARDIKLLKDGSHFKIKQNTFHLQVPGIHNVINALAAISVAEVLEIPIQHIQEGLRNFQGIERRLEHIGCCEKINIYDDYSHNPAKIEAALSALRNFSRRLTVIYQPHGFGPLKLQREDLIQVFKKALNPKDLLILLPIYDAGGTADRSISAEDVVLALKKQGVPAAFFPNRKSLISHITESAVSEDSIIVMGARDNSLTDLAHSILEQIQKSKTKMQN